MHIRRSTSGYLRVMMILGLARVAGAQTAAPAPTAPKPPPTPTPLAVDGQLTPWLQVRGEFRARVEGFTGGGFADNRDAYWMDRFRLNATASPSTLMKFVVQVQDARAFDKTIGSQNVPLRDTLDVRMAYGEFGSTNSVRRRPAGVGVRRAASARTPQLAQHSA